LEKALDEYTGENLPKKTLHSLINEWEVFVGEVERGYRFTIWDYENDLSIRDFLEKIKKSLSDDGREKISVLIESIDEKFLAATIAVDRPLLLSVSDEPPSFWWYRIPKRLESDLEQDLRKEGFL